MLFEPLTAVKARLGVLIGAAGEFEDALVALFKDGWEPNTGMTYAEFEAEETDFTGYARSAAVVWGAAGIDDSGNAVVAAASVQFTATAATVSNVVGGYAVLNAAGTGILWAEKFLDADGNPAPVTINAAGKFVVVVPKYTLGRKVA